MSNSFDTEIGFIPTENGEYKTLEEVMAEDNNRQPQKKMKIIDFRPRKEKNDIINFIPTIKK